MAEGRVYLTTFIEGVLVHGSRRPSCCWCPTPAFPAPGPAHAAQMPWSPGLPAPGPAAGPDRPGWKIPFRFVDTSTLPVVFDERTSRLPTPWLLSLEGLEGQQRLYLTHLLRTKAPEDLLPPPPNGGQWVSEKGLQNADLMPGVRRLCQAALQAVREG